MSDAWPPQPDVFREAKALSFGEQLCRAWGLDPDQVSKIEIVIDGPALPVATVTMRPGLEEVGSLLLGC
jgi:hypothetical protein